MCVSLSRSRGKGGVFGGGGVGEGSSGLGFVVEQLGALAAKVWKRHAVKVVVVMFGDCSCLDLRKEQMTRVPMDGKYVRWGDDVKRGDENFQVEHQPTYLFLLHITGNTGFATAGLFAGRGRRLQFNVRLVIRSMLFHWPVAAGSATSLCNPRPSIAIQSSLLH